MTTLEPTQTHMRHWGNMTPLAPTERHAAESWYQLCRSWPTFQDVIPSSAPWRGSQGSGIREPILYGGVWKIRTPIGIIYLETMRTILNDLEPSVRRSVETVRALGEQTGRGGLPTTLLRPNTTAWRRSDLEIIAVHMLEFRDACTNAVRPLAQIANLPYSEV